MISPAITNPKQGFNNRKKLNPKIPNHENNNEHHVNMFKQKDFKTSLNKDTTIDCPLQIEIKNGNLF